MRVDRVVVLLRIFSYLLEIDETSYSNNRNDVNVNIVSPFSPHLLEMLP